ncbi:hypothetical protein BJY04DRAFT_224890 [Aspergillus karnatakaensis]|uniref:uncharacterized protein n=1 Tax=Aspergillus karnatakaensis TaxID=1810916 RepID=UPI003CCD9C12
MQHSDSSSHATGYTGSSVGHTPEKTPVNPPVKMLVNTPVNTLVDAPIKTLINPPFNLSISTRFHNTVNSEAHEPQCSDYSTHTILPTGSISFSVPTPNQASVYGSTMLDLYGNGYPPSAAATAVLQHNLVHSVGEFPSYNVAPNPGIWWDSPSTQSPLLLDPAMLQHNANVPVFDQNSVNMQAPDTRQTRSESERQRYHSAGF